MNERIYSGEYYWNLFRNKPVNRIRYWLDQKQRYFGWKKTNIASYSYI